MTYIYANRLNHSRQQVMKMFSAAKTDLVDEIVDFIGCTSGVGKVLNVRCCIANGECPNEHTEENLKTE